MLGCKLENCAVTDIVVVSKPGNRALADAVAAREFDKRGTVGPSLAGLVLLRLGQFWFPTPAPGA